MSEIEISDPRTLSVLRGQGVDAYLSVRVAAGPDGLPQSASARMNSTQTGQVLQGVSWQNGWGGQSGSIMDRAMRKDVSAAAAEIADALVGRVRR